MYLNSREADALVELKNNVLSMLNDFKNDLDNFDKDSLLSELNTQINDFDKAKAHLDETIYGSKDAKNKEEADK